jgi:hypothetical protein
MKHHPIFALIATCLFALPMNVFAEEHYTETVNCVRIFDWDTLTLLMNTKVPKVNIHAKSGEDLLSQINTALKDIKEIQDLKIDYQRELWEVKRSDGTTGKISANVELKLENVSLLTLIRYICDSNKMTFSVKKGKVLFRPLLG